jgi:hypothetical protein
MGSLEDEIGTPLASLSDAHLFVRAARERDPGTAKAQLRLGHDEGRAANGALPAVEPSVHVAHDIARIIADDSS